MRFLDVYFSQLNSPQFQLMNKNEAIEIARTTHSVKLERANTHFSNVNQKKPVWWIEVPLRKLDEHNQINLVVEKSGVVTLLEVPTSFLKENLEGFRIRDEKTNAVLGTGYRDVSKCHRGGQA